MCGIFGYQRVRADVDELALNRMVNVLAMAATRRGTEATGIAYVEGGKVRIDKAPSSAFDMDFAIPAGTRTVIGHTRFATQGVSKNNFNNHPFPGRAGISATSFALVHNGIIYNDSMLFTKYGKPDKRVETDSYALVSLLEDRSVRSKSLAEPADIGKALEEVRGVHAVAVLTARDELVLWRQGNPLHSVFLEKAGVFVFASTKEILLEGLASCPEWYRESGGDKGEIKGFPEGIVRRYTQGQKRAEASFVAPTPAYTSTAYTGGYPKDYRGKAQSYMYDEYMYDEYMSDRYWDKDTLQYRTKPAKATVKATPKAAAVAVPKELPKATITKVEPKPATPSPAELSARTFSLQLAVTEDAALLSISKAILQKHMDEEIIYDQAEYITLLDALKLCYDCAAVTPKNDCSTCVLKVSIRDSGVFDCMDCPAPPLIATPEDVGTACVECKYFTSNVYNEDPTPDDMDDAVFDTIKSAYEYSGTHANPVAKGAVRRIFEILNKEAKANAKK